MTIQRTTQPTTHRPIRLTAQRVAAGWAFLFAAPHLLWAAGSQWGLRTALSADVVDGGGGILRLANLGIALFCITGGLVALADGRLPRRLRLPLLWFGAVLLAGRAVDIYVEFGRALTGLNPIPADRREEVLHLSRWFLFGYLPWFALGAIVWTMLAVQVTRRRVGTCLPSRSWTTTSASR